MTVFHMDKNFEIILNPEAVKLVPELRSLDQQELEYVILVIDYVDGPYRKKPLDERKLMARKKVYGDNKKNTETKRIQIAMDGYKSLVFDIRRETIDVYNNKIRIIQRETLSPDTTFTRIKEINNTVEYLQDRIIKMEHDLDIDEKDDIKLEGKKTLSYIEVWQRKQMDHKEYKSSI